MLRNVREVGFQTPEHYRREYPQFLEFMDLYFNWLYNKKGLKQEEFDLMVDQGMSLEEIAYYQTVQAPGTTAKDLAADRMLEREFVSLETADGLIIEDENGDVIDAEKYLGMFQQAWLDDMGFKLSGIQAGDEKFRRVDATRFIKLLAHIYSIRGSVASMELFFSIFYSGQATVEFPRVKISAIDDNFMLDGGPDAENGKENHLRDDDFYSEFSYLVNVSGTPDPNIDVFMELYNNMFHPSGFKMFTDEGFPADLLERMNVSVEAYRVACQQTLPFRFKGGNYQ